MQIIWTKKAENNLSRIFEHTVQNFSYEKAEMVSATIYEYSTQLSRHPELGRKIGGHFLKRYLFILGNVLIYEIVLEPEPVIFIRNIKPRKTG